MKPIIFLLSFISFAAAAQTPEQKKMIIEIGFDSRRPIIFPGQIEDDICGNENITVDKSKNKLYIQANTKDGFDPTNLYVELTSGHYYSIVLKYNNAAIDPVIISLDEATGNLNAKTIEATPVKTTTVVDVAKQNQVVEQKTEPTKTTIPSEISMNDPLSVATMVIAKKQNVFNCEAYQRSIHFVLETLYTYDNKLYMKIVVKNNSHLDYQILDIEFAIVQNTSLFSKTTSNDGKPLQSPLVAVYNKDVKTVGKKSQLVKVFVYEKFTLSEKTSLSVKLFERDGARELTFNVDSKTIDKAAELK